MTHMTSERGVCYVLECYVTCEGSVRGFWKPPAFQPLRLAKILLQFIYTIKVIPVSADLAAASGAGFVFFPATKIKKNGI